jgi:hypothetical protein
MVATGTPPTSKLALSEITVAQAGGELPYGNGEVHAVHLGDDQVADGDVAVRGAADLELVPRHVEGQGVDVVPMGMGDEDGAVEAAPPGRHELIGQRLDTGAAVEDEEPAVGELEAHARGVAPVSATGRTVRT